MHTPEEHYMDWVPGDLAAAPEAETAVVSMTVGGVPLTIRDGVVDSVDKELETLGKDFLKEYVPQFGDVSMWMAGVIEEVAEGVVTDVRLPSDGEPVGKLEPERTDEKTFQTEIVKINTERKQVFGWASLISKNGVPTEDTQGDLISADDLEKMAYGFVSECRVGGEMHVRKGVGKLIESLVLTVEKAKAMGIELPGGVEGWWTGWQVTDDDVWDKVKKGEYKAFSVHGVGIRTKIDKE